jgi:hypothetical protein
MALIETTVLRWLCFLVVLWPEQSRDRTPIYSNRVFTIGGEKLNALSHTSLAWQRMRASQEPPTEFVRIWRMTRHDWAASSLALMRESETLRSAQRENSLK